MAGPRSHLDPLHAQLPRRRKRRLNTNTRPGHAPESRRQSYGQERSKPNQTR